MDVIGKDHLDCQLTFLKNGAPLQYALPGTFSTDTKWMHGTFENF